jgi:hypothetical protein
MPATMSGLGFARASKSNNPPVVVPAVYLRGHFRDLSGSGEGAVGDVHKISRRFSEIVVRGDHVGRRERPRVPVVDIHKTRAVFGRRLQNGDFFFNRTLK